MKCENCKATIKNNNSFCYNCGFYQAENQFETEVVNKKYKQELVKFIERINECFCQAKNVPPYQSNCVPPSLKKRRRRKYSFCS
ncbi:hypothetical protein SAMN04515654_13721 [Halanaerobium congolense]|uniref:Zinc-ribbon domain-containing protein n=2 Tax=Halanaerobium congolense TaxID=54121 RepID=A0A1G8S6T6_9FIRM|nr:hypothetical protein SAMN04515654_13721 [Halanaerobium congolense]